MSSEWYYLINTLGKENTSQGEVFYCFFPYRSDMKLLRRSCKRTHGKKDGKLTGCHRIKGGPRRQREVNVNSLLTKRKHRQSAILQPYLSGTELDRNSGESAHQHTSWVKQAEVQAAGMWSETSAVPNQQTLFDSP